MLTDPRTIDPFDTQGHVRSLKSIRREVIAIALEVTHNKVDAARQLRISRTTLYRDL